MALKAQEQKANDRQLLLFLMSHLLTGLIGGLVFGVLILWSDVGHLRTLAFASEDTALILGLFFFGLFGIFGAAGLSAGFMSLTDDRD